MSSPPPKTSPLDDGAINTNASMSTKEGLPFDPRFHAAAFATIDVGDGPVTVRRIDCRPPRLLSAPSIYRPNMSSSALTKSSIALVPGPNSSSLIDDDDELIDYFSTSVGDDAKFAHPVTPATDNVMPILLTLKSSRWNVREHNVRSLPSFYPLEQSAVFVPRASASIMAARIAAILQSRSIAASFDALNAKVDCVSKFRVEFRIRLYRGRGDYNHGIIAEVQRRAGFDLSYEHDVNAILDTAEDKNTKEYSGGTPPRYGSSSCVDLE